MPYTIDNPPEAISDLPKHAQEIWVKAFNNAYKQYEDEKKAFQTAWAAVKRDYKKEDGNWVRKMIVPSDIPELMKPGRIVPMPGRILVAPHGEKIWKGEKGAIVSTRHYKKYVDQPVYLIEGEKALGIVTMGEPKKIGMKKFKDLRSIHKIREEERKEWWGDADTFYYYPIEVISKFDPPKEIERPKNAKTWLKSVVFKSIDVSNPEDLSDKELREEHKRLHSLWASLGRPAEDILNYHILLRREMERRGISHEHINDLDEKAKEFTFELSEIIRMKLG